VIPDNNIVRRLVGDGKISVLGVLDFFNPGPMTDIQIGLDTNLTRLTNYYTKQESDSKFENVSRIQVSSYPYTFSSDRFWHVGRLSLPSDGHHAIITVNACNGRNWNFSGAVNLNGYNITNCQMTAHIYSSKPSTSRAIDPGSLGPDAWRYDDPAYRLFYNGFAVATTPFITPLGFYLAPVPGNPTSQVDIWIHSPKWHGVPLVQVVQTA